MFLCGAVMIVVVTVWNNLTPPVKAGYPMTTISKKMDALPR